MQQEQCFYYIYDEHQEIILQGLSDQFNSHLHGIENAKGSNKILYS
jgi:hypothetical protein